MLSKLRELPLTVHLGADLIGFRMRTREPAGHFAGIPVWEVMGRPLSGWGDAVKVVEDYVLASLLLIFFMPLMALTWIAVKLESPGPAIFCQDRLGFNNRRFKIYKFRTMRHSATPERKTTQAVQNDPRVTRIGRFLRQDEPRRAAAAFQRPERHDVIGGPSAARRSITTSNMPARSAGTSLGIASSRESPGWPR